MQAFSADTQGPQPVFSQMSVAEFNRSATEDTFASIFQLDRDLPAFDWGPGTPAEGEFTGVTYKLADNVVKVDQAVTQNIKSVEQVTGKKSGSGSINRIIGQGGLLKADLLKTTVGQSVIRPGSVFVDEDNGLAFKVPSLPGQSGDAFDGYVPVVRPSFNEVVKEFVIPDQTVHLNQSNIKYFANDVDGNSLSQYLVKPGTTYIMSYDSDNAMEPLKPKHIKNVVTAMRLPEKGVKMRGITRSGTVYDVYLNGYMAFGDMDLRGSYGAKGYEFYLTCTEELQLQAKVAVDFDEEIKIPLFGLGISLGKSIGSVSGGLFLVVGVDGKLTIQAEARQWMTLEKAGLKGKCILYVPVSVGPLFKMGDYGFDLDALMYGAVDGSIKAGAELGINIFGFDLIGAGIYGGMGVNSQSDGSYIDARLYGIVQAYASLIGKKKYIVNWQPTILHKRIKDTAGYILSFKEVCAYRDEIWGTLHIDGGTAGFIPVPDKDMTILVRRAGTAERSYAAKTDKDGRFHARGVDLKKDDQVVISLQERNGTKIVETEAVAPTFPFDKAIMLEADFFNDYEKAYIPTAIVKDWDTDKNVELKFDASKVPGSKLTINGKPVSGQNQYGEFVHTGNNVLPNTVYQAQLSSEGFVIGPSNSIMSSASFSLTPLRIPVSSEVTVENGKPVDVGKDLEAVVLVNDRGNKVYTGDAIYVVSAYTEDSLGCHLINPETGMPMLQNDSIDDQTVQIKAIDLNKGEADGTSYFSNTILKKWFWENPKEDTTDQNVRGRNVIDLTQSVPETAPIQSAAETTPAWSMPLIASAQSATELPTLAALTAPGTTAPDRQLPVRPPMTRPDGSEQDNPETNTDGSGTTSPTAPTAPSDTPANPDIPQQTTEPSTGGQLIDTKIQPYIKLYPIDPDFTAIFANSPQNTIILSYDDPVDDWYKKYSARSGTADNDLIYDVDGSKYFKWDSKVIIKYEGAEIIAEYKDDRREYDGDHRIEYLSSEWLEKDTEGLLNRYMEKYSDMTTIPMPDEISKGSGISNLGRLPSWSKAASVKMADAGIMDLGRDENFKSGNVNRSECAAYLSRVFGIAPEMSKSTFSDIIYVNPYIPEINAAVSYGIISGYNAQSFGPGDPVTREQMAAMVMRGLKKKLGSGLSIPSAGKSFKDNGSVSSYAKDAVSEISALGIMGGYPDGSFGPKKNITFNEMAVMLSKVQELVNRK